MHPENESERKRLLVYILQAGSVGAMKVRIYRQIYTVSFSSNNNYIARYICEKYKEEEIKVVPHHFPPSICNLSQIDNRPRTLRSDYTPFACIGYTEDIYIYSYSPQINQFTLAP